MKITYWSDYACPFCYIGEAQMKKAIAELPQLGQVELEMKSFELDPYAANYVEGDPAEHLAKKYSTSIEVARQQIERISNLGKKEGLEMNFGKVKSCNTMDAHRLTKRRPYGSGQGGGRDRRRPSGRRRHRPSEPGR